MLELLTYMYLVITLLSKKLIVYDAHKSYI